jgi:hypothetical protein
MREIEGESAKLGHNDQIAVLLPKGGRARRAEFGDSK